MMLLSPILLWLGVPERLLRAWAIFLLTASLILAAGIGKRAYDRSIISEHENKKEVQELHRTIRNERRANAGAETARRREAAEAAQLKGAIDHAVRVHPQEVRRSSGPAANAALEQLRHRQASGERSRAVR